MFALLIHCVDFFDAPLVPPSRELRAQEFQYDSDRLVVSHDFPAQGQYIGVIVLACPPRCQRIVRQRSADALHFVRGNRNPDPRAAYEYTQGIFPRDDALPNRTRKIRIVHRSFRPCSDIIDSIARAFEIFLDVFLRAKPGVVGAQRNARLGRGFCHKYIKLILSESAGEFQFR
jgi:hypothetical protein